MEGSGGSKRNVLIVHIDRHSAERYDPAKYVNIDPIVINMDAEAHPVSPVEVIYEEDSVTDESHIS